MNTPDNRPASEESTQFNQVKDCLEYAADMGAYPNLTGDTEPLLKYLKVFKTTNEQLAGGKIRVYQMEPRNPGSLSPVEYGIHLVDGTLVLMGENLYRTLLGTEEFIKKPTKETVRTVYLNTVRGLRKRKPEAD